MAIRTYFEELKPENSIESLNKTIAIRITFSSNPEDLYFEEGRHKKLRVSGRRRDWVLVSTSLIEERLHKLKRN